MEVFIEHRVGNIFLVNLAQIISYLVNSVLVL